MSWLLWGLTVGLWIRSRGRNVRPRPESDSSRLETAANASGARASFRTACVRSDAAAARRHLLEWFAAVRGASQGRPSLNELARASDDPHFALLLRELDRACFTGCQWDGQPLSHALRVLPCRGPTPSKRPAALGPLYPATLVLIAVASMVAVSNSSAAVSAPRRAVWVEHDLTMELQHLPRRYLCSELDAKIHDILATIGARANMRVEASRCEADIDPAQIAPWVHLIFSLPFEVHGELAHSAEMFAVERTVRLEPGSPQSIDWGDCQLLRQLKVTLFAQIPMQVDGDHLGCQSSATRHTPFSVSLDVLTPAAEPAKVSLVRPASRAASSRSGAGTQPLRSESAV